MINDMSSRTILNNGVEMPWLGLGVLKLKEGGEVERAVAVAIENGYRLIDNAAIYHNEKGVAKGIRASGIPRKELFLSSKIANDQQGYHSTFKAFQRSLDWLQTDYLDLYLIHWPKGDHSIETWKAMEELYAKGKIRALGLSNYWVHHLEYFLPRINVIPAVNQVEFHPELTQAALHDYCKNHNIQLQAWSPLMQGKVFEIPKLNEIAAKYGKTPVQVVLRWDLQKGVVTIPRTGKPKEIISNAQIFDFELSEKDVEEIDNLNKDRKIFPYYDRFTHLVKMFLKNKRKFPIIMEFFKAVYFKVNTKLTLVFNRKLESSEENADILLRKKR
jgi:methylglyoxal/glyoxal reductase